MPEYKVGEWYPHAMLRECPIHPEDKVSVIEVDRGYPCTGCTRTADHFKWENVVAFKVVEEYQEPLVLWVNIFPPPSGLFVHYSKSSAEAGRGDRCIRTVKMMEVKE